MVEWLPLCHKTALRYARRQTAAERNPWGQGRDAALRMVARAVVAGDPYFRAPVVSDATAYIFPAFVESNVRRVANGVVAIETDAYCKAVESVGLSQDGDFFVLAISATINNKGVTLARFFIQRATRHVARTCYKFFFQGFLKINPSWAPWHVLVQRQLSVVDPTLDGGPSATVLQLATENVRRMTRVDEHAQSILFGCKAHAHRVCDRAPLSVRASLRKLIECQRRSVCARPSSSRSRLATALASWATRACSRRFAPRFRRRITRSRRRPRQPGTQRSPSTSGFISCAGAGSR